MPSMVYGMPEWEDVVFSYLSYLVHKGGGFVDTMTLAKSMGKDMGVPVVVGDVASALGSLEDKGLVYRRGNEWSIPSLDETLRIQMGMEEVVPFTRDPSEVPESHLNGVSKWDIESELVKPEAGGRYGLAPTSHFFAIEKPWRGLVQE